MQPEATHRERFTAYAEALRARFNKGILKTMQDKPLWGLYKLEEDEKGNVHKPPYHSKGYKISRYKPEQWSSGQSRLNFVGEPGDRKGLPVPQTGFHYISAS